MTDEATTNSHGIADALTQHAVPIDVPVLHPTNPRRGDVSAITESLSRFGQVRPIIVQKSSAYVIAGNHTLRAARELGWTHIAVVPIDISDEEAEAYLVADNRLGDLGTYDNTVLVPMLERMMLSGRLEGTGYTPDYVDDQLAAMDALPEVEPPEFEGGHSVTDEELGERFKNRSQSGPLRQFVLMYDQETAATVDAAIKKLERAWGVSGAREVVLESLRRATDAEQAADPEPADDDAAGETTAGTVEPDRSLTEAAQQQAGDSNVAPGHPDAVA